VARADPAFAVEPDYYAKAVGWDARMAQEHANIALGWGATAALTLARPGVPGRITVHLSDAAGHAVTGAAVSIEAMHNARASQRYEATLQPGRDGDYTSPVDAHRPGAWEVRLTATRGEARFTQSLRIDAPAEQR
jgi:nitrogen fixation protein FixH